MVVTIDVPDDVAAEINEVKDISAFFVDAVRQLTRINTVMGIQRRAGRPIPREVLDRARAEILALRADRDLRSTVADLLAH